MACFLVPTAEAIVTTVIAKTAKEEKKDYTHIDAETGEAVSEKPAKMSFVRKLKWLSNMLWGGAVLLCFEHLWHGEVRLREVSQCLLLWRWNSNVLSSELHFPMVS